LSRLTQSEYQPLVAQIKTYTLISYKQGASMKITFRSPHALAVLFLVSAAPELTVNTAFAADVCAQISVTRLAEVRTRTGQSSGCNQPPFSTHLETARNRARDAAVATIDQACRNNVTERMARAACNAAGGEVNEWPFIFTPGRSIPAGAARISVVGKGVGAAHNMNICVNATDGASSVTRERSPGSCSDSSSSAFPKTTATAAATARCGVVCIVP
jgi:hypothetical protein